MEKRNTQNKNNKPSSVKEYISKRVTPIFDKALKETPKNHVSVGSGQIGESFSYSFYNPHNARYYFKFDRKNISKKPRGGVGSFNKDLRVINSTELCNDNFLGCRVVIKKHLIEVTNKINKERLIAIDGSEDNRDKLVKESISMMLHECIDVLYKFIKTYGGNSNYICVNHHVLDNKILHDKIVDSIPSKTTFRNDIVKNVYKTNPPNIEYNDPVHASNYFRNMGLHDYSPAIANELSNLKSEITEVREAYHKDLEVLRNEALQPLTEQIKIHLAVQHSTLEVQREMSETLKEFKEDLRNNKKEEKYSKAKKMLYKYGW